MHAIARQADRALPEFEGVWNGWRRVLGEAVGEALTMFRSGVLDRVVSREKSYRSTLAGSTTASMRATRRSRA